MVFDNHDATYVSGVLPPQVLAGINAGIARYTATAGCRELLDPSLPSVRGPRANPAHDSRRARSPGAVGHEQLLLDYVTAAGHLDNLSQSHYARFGHVEAFTPAEIAAAFDALVAWTNTG
jgi:hypothetical protein